MSPPMKKVCVTTIYDDIKFEKYTVLKWIIIRATHEHIMLTFSGSTAAGLYWLEKSGFRSALIGALEAATDKCKEMGKSFEKPSWNHGSCFYHCNIFCIIN